MSELLLAGLLVLLVVLAVAALRAADLLIAVILLGAYGFVMSLIWAVIGAGDVAFTEAVVGAGVSTVLLLAALLRTSRRRSPPMRPLRWAAFGLTVATGAVLAALTAALPPFGDPAAPAAQHVSPRYLERTLAETATSNAVTSVLADYRGYDTLLETTVILTAGLACWLLLAPRRRDVAVIESHGSVVVQTFVRILIPLVQIFAFYVLLFGHDGPGGGFQAGVMLGASYLLLALAFGREELARRVNEPVCLALAATGVIIYLGTGLMSMALGGHLLDYGVLRVGESVPRARYFGILFVETGVGLGVAATIVLVFCRLADSEPA
jgi:multicomponent Na+:H+ antiporter subunit B